MGLAISLTGYLTGFYQNSDKNSAPDTSISDILFCSIAWSMFRAESLEQGFLMIKNLREAGGRQGVCIADGSL